MVYEYETKNFVIHNTKSTGKVFHFENEDVIITDPSYIIKQNEDCLYEICSYKYDDYNLIKINNWEYNKQKQKI